MFDPLRECVCGESILPLDRHYGYFVVTIAGSFYNAPKYPLEKMKMEIKHYTKDRIPDVLRFERDLRSEENFWGWEIDEKYIADVTASFENPAFANSLSLLAYMDGKVVGRIDSTKICSHFDGSTKAYLDWICVIKSYRHRGVAQVLMQTLRTELKAQGVDTLIGLIASNEDAQRFYRNLPNAEIKDEGIWIDL